MVLYTLKIKYVTFLDSISQNNLSVQKSNNIIPTVSHNV